MKEDRWRMTGEDTTTAVHGVGIVGGGSDHIGHSDTRSVLI